MANETLASLGKTLENAARALGGAEAPPPPPSSPESAVVIEAVGEAPAPKRSGLESLVEATKQQLEAVADKFKQATSETAKRIVGDPEKTAPRDARVLEIVKELLTADEETASDPAFLRKNAEKLVGVAQESGFNSVAGKEARRYLHNIVQEAPTLQYLEQSVYLPISGASGQPSAVEKIFADSGDSLAGTPLEAELKKYKQFLQYDTSDRHDTHKVARHIDEIKEIGYKQGLPEGQVKDAIGRLQAVIEETNEELAEIRARESMRGGQTIIRWRDVKHLVPKDAEGNPLVSRDENDMIPFMGSSDEMKTLTSGYEGEREWFSKFVNGVYGVGKEQAHPDLPDMYRWESFKNYMEWVYGKDAEFHIDPFRAAWNDRSRHEFIFKSLSYQPGSVEDKIKSFRRLLGADLDNYVKNYEWAEYTLPIYMQSALDLMADKQARYNKSVEFMLKNVKNPIWDEMEKPKGQDIVTNDELYKILREHDSKGLLDAASLVKRQKDLQDKLSRGERLSSDEHVEFNKLGEEIRKREFIKRQMWEIKDHIDVVAEGVMLWDSDVLVYSELYHEWIDFKRQYEALQMKAQTGVSLSETEKEALETLPDIIEKKKQSYERAKKFEEGNGALKSETLRRYRGLSPLEIEVRKRLVSYLMDKDPEQYKTEADIPEWKIRDAIWASRMTMVGSGHLIAIGAFMSTRPVDDKSFIKSLSFAEGKSAMRAPFAEDIQRFFNPEVFASRFSMGGAMGDKARAILRRNLIHGKDKDFKITNTKEWKEHGVHIDDSETRMMRAYMEFAEQELGISFSELLAPGFFEAGGDFDATGWRLEGGAFDEMRKKVIEQGGGPTVWENQAMGIQLGMVGGEKAEQEKVRILERMLERTPAVFLQYLAGETMNDILAKRGLNEKEWTALQRSLSLAQTKLWDRPDLAGRTIDMGEKGDFNELVAPFLRKQGVTDEGRIAACLGVIQDVQKLAREERSGAERKTLLERWAHHKFPLTLTLSDFNWKDVNFFKMGTAAMDRRGRDMGGMAQAKDIMLDILSKPAFLSPNDPMETLKKIYELRMMVNSYTTSTAAETVAKEALRTFIEFNRNRAIHGAWWLKGLTYLPGVQTFMRYYGEADYRHLKDNRILNKITGDGWRDFAEKKIEKWPHSVAEAMSYSIRFTGAEGNAYDELKIAEILATAQDMGIFTEHPEFVADLRKEFEATIGGRVWNTARKYWWVVIVATVALAATQAIEDEQKRHA